MTILPVTDDRMTKEERQEITEKVQLKSDFASQDEKKIICGCK